MRIFTTLLSVFVITGLSAQSNIYDLTTISLADLSGFKNPANQWQIVGNITATKSDTELKSQAGVGILHNKVAKSGLYAEGQNLFTSFEHGDIYLELDFMMPKGSNSGIYLQGRYEVQLYDSWGVANPKQGDCGGIYQRWIEATQVGYEGHAPRTNACLAPGLWQHLAIEFKAPRFDAAGKKTQNAVMKKVILNGITIHENVVLSGSTRAAAFNDEKPTGPLMIQGDHGQIAFRNIKYAQLGDFQPVLKNITYEYYEGDLGGFEKLNASNLTRKGTAQDIDCRLADNINKMTILFNGSFDIDETADYQWLLKRNGVAKLSVDLKEVFNPTWGLTDEKLMKSMRLEKGSHTFSIGYIKNFGWRPTALGLFLIKPNKRPAAFHATASLPDPDPVPQITVEVKNRNELVRHYVMHGSTKKTHVISVGNPRGLHFMYDLNQAGLMSSWKGNFLNTTEMWFERGEPQTAEAMGAGIAMAGRCPLAIVEPNQSLPDTLDPYKELIFKGYTLDTDRNPTFKFNYKDVSFTENFSISPLQNGLSRNIKVLNPMGKKILYRLAEGESITDLGNGTYSIDNQKYYLQINTTDRPNIINNKTKKELVIEKNDKESSVSYSLIF
jgi:hypothetical protein